MADKKYHKRKQDRDYIYDSDDDDHAQTIDTIEEQERRSIKLRETKEAREAREARDERDRIWQTKVARLITEARLNGKDSDDIRGTLNAIVSQTFLADITELQESTEQDYVNTPEPTRGTHAQNRGNTLTTLDDTPLLSKTTIKQSHQVTALTTTTRLKTTHAAIESKSTLDNTYTGTCALCGYRATTDEDFLEHIQGHTKQAALAAAPKLARKSDDMPKATSKYIDAYSENLTEAKYVDTSQEISRLQKGIALLWSLYNKDEFDAAHLRQDIAISSSVLCDVLSLDETTLAKFENHLRDVRKLKTVHKWVKTLSLFAYYLADASRTETEKLPLNSTGKEQLESFAKRTEKRATKLKKQETREQRARNSRESLEERGKWSTPEQIVEITESGLRQYWQCIERAKTTKLLDVEKSFCSTYCVLVYLVNSKQSRGGDPKEFLYTDVMAAILNGKTELDEPVLRIRKHKTANQYGNALALLDPATITLLDAYEKHIRPQCQKTNNEKETFFLAARGGKLSHTGLRVGNLLKKLSGDANMQITPSQIRKIYSTWVVTKGVNLPVERGCTHGAGDFLQTAFDHSPAVSRTYYQKPNKDDFAKTARRYQKLLPQVRVVTPDPRDASQFATIGSAAAAAESTDYSDDDTWLLGPFDTEKRDPKTGASKERETKDTVHGYDRHSVNATNATTKAGQKAKHGDEQQQADDFDDCVDCNEDETEYSRHAASDDE